MGSEDSKRKYHNKQSISKREAEEYLVKSCMKRIQILLPMQGILPLANKWKHDLVNEKDKMKKGISLNKITRGYLLFTASVF